MAGVTVKNIPKYDDTSEVFAFVMIAHKPMEGTDLVLTCIRSWGELARKDSFPPRLTSAETMSARLGASADSNRRVSCPIQFVDKSSADHLHHSMVPGRSMLQSCYSWRQLSSRLTSD